METTLLQLGYIGVVYERLKIREGNFSMQWVACDAEIRGPQHGPIYYDPYYGNP